MSKPNLIVLARSEPWCSAISRNFPECELSWVLNVPALIGESFKFQASAAIVELPAAGADELCIELSELCNNSVQLKLFAVGDRGLLRWQPLLQAAGVATWYWSLLQIPSLVQAIARHHGSVRYVSQSTESRVWADLPWPTAASDPHA
jgi:hypothetical protein